MRRVGVATAIMVAVLVVAGLARAQERDCVIEIELVCHTYIPAVMTTEPTPTLPPALNTLVLQRGDVPSSLRRDEFREITNNEAAQGYPDPAAALLAFEQQGRESSWYVRYLRSSASTIDATGISDQVVRFLSVAGADTGLDYMVANEMTTAPGFLGPYALPAGYGERGVWCMRTFTVDENTWEEYVFAIRVGRYVTFLQVIGLASALTPTKAGYYSYLAANRLPDSPNSAALPRIDEAALYHTGQDSQGGQQIPMRLLTTH